MKKHNEFYYSDYPAREALRSLAYGGSCDSKSPNGYSSWGDYWKGL
jgi:hypothetical protein